MSFINFLIVKSLVKTKYANIVNFAADKEIIPEHISIGIVINNIFNNVSLFLEDPYKIFQQVKY